MANGANGRRQPAEQAIDTGFAQRRQVTSQRAIAPRNRKLADDIPVQDVNDDVGRLHAMHAAAVPHWMNIEVKDRATGSAANKRCAKAISRGQEQWLVRHAHNSSAIAATRR